MSEYTPTFHEPLAAQEGRRFANIAPLRSFFTKWCEVNDSIRPQFMDREEWDERGGLDALLEPVPQENVSPVEVQDDDRPTLEALFDTPADESDEDPPTLGDDDIAPLPEEPGTPLVEEVSRRSPPEQNLFIPKDVQPHELLRIIQAIDHDTYADEPDLREQRFEQLQELGRMFRNAGIYMAGRFHVTDEHMPLATDFAYEFYRYGSNLLGHDQQETLEQGLRTIAQQELTPEEEQEVDEWLLGSEVYQKQLRKLRRRLKLGPDDEIPQDKLNEHRDRIIRILFAAMDREPSRKVTAAEPWAERRGPFARLQQTVDDRTRSTMRMPEREAHTALFDRGVEMLINGMGYESVDERLEALGIELDRKRDTLREAIGVDQMRASILAAREAGNDEVTAALEQQYAERIQQIVGSYRYQRRAANPARMLEQQELNCVGASILGSAFLEEIGIDHLHVNVPGHALMLLVTSDGKVRWHDMLTSRTNGELTDDMVQDATVAEIGEIARDSSERKAIRFRLSQDAYEERVPWFSTERPHVTAFDPKTGQQIDVLEWTSTFLQEEGQNKESCIAMQKAVELLPDNAELRWNYASTLERIEATEQAIIELRHAIALDPSNPSLYNRLGGCLRETKQTEEAAAAYREAERLYREAIEEEPESPFHEMHLAFTLSRLERAEDYQASLAVAEAKFRQALEADNAPELHTGLANLLLRRDNRDQANQIEAIYELMEAFKSDRENAGLASRIADMLAVQEHDYARFYYDCALELTPDNAELRHHYGTWLYNQRRYEEAAVEFERVLKQQPDHQYAHQFLAGAMMHLEQFEGAEQEYARAIEIYEESVDDAPELSQYPRGDIYARHSIALMDCGRTNEAVARMARALELNSEGYTVISKLGELREKQERYDEALDAYWEAYTRSKDDDLLQAMIRISPHIRERRHIVFTQFKIAAAMFTHPIRDGIDYQRKAWKYNRAERKVEKRNPRYTGFFFMPPRNRPN